MPVFTTLVDDTTFSYVVSMVYQNTWIYMPNSSPL